MADNQRIDKDIEEKVTANKNQQKVCKHKYLTERFY